MKKDKKFIAALLLIAATGPLCAQEVWRCGNQYSQRPCANGTALQTGDPRTADDAAQAEAAVRRQARAADELERARLAQESKAAPANILPQNAEPTARDGKEYKPVHFTAIAPKTQSDPAKKAKKKKKRPSTKRSN